MAKYDRKEMTIDELTATHELYGKYVKLWEFFMACYEGIKALIDGGWAIKKHERESQDNYERREAGAYGFGYSTSIVDIFNFYLFKNTPKRDMGPLANDKQWQLFAKDCNLYGDAFETWLLETQRYAGILGHLGILVDKSSKQYATADEELKARVYPYVARYFPQNILDWEYKRDENNRPYLAYLKLQDDDGLIRIWTTEWWATYRLPEDGEGTHTVKDVDTGETRGAGATAGGGTKKTQQQTVQSENDGNNPFMDDNTGRGEIPFVWLYNVRSKTRPLGVSDIKDVSYIDVSIIRNCSEGEEVITYAAFPMLLKPMEEEGRGATNRGGQDDVGVTAVIEFDPENPDSIPQWLESKVGEPIDAILKWMELKVSEIYRATNVGGMAATEIQTAPKSGTALKSEFQLLNGKLVSKGTCTEKAELGIKKYWGRWQNKSEEEMDKIVVEWPETYDVADLAQDLENALTAKVLVQSSTFLAAVQKQVARAMLPNADDKTLKAIDKEIEDAAKKAVKDGGDVPGSNVIGAGGKTGGKLVPLPGQNPQQGGAIQSQNTGTGAQPAPASAAQPAPAPAAQPPTGTEG